MLKFTQGKNNPNLRGCHCLDIQNKTIQLILTPPLTHSNKIILESRQSFAAANLFLFPFFLQKVIFWSVITKVWSMNLVSVLEIQLCQISLCTSVLSTQINHSLNTVNTNCSGSPVILMKNYLIIVGADISQ